MATEMTGDLPSSDDAFSATSDLLCANSLFDARDSPRLSLSDCLRMILGKDWDAANEHNLKMLSTLNLFSIINGQIFGQSECLILLTIQAFNTIIFTAKANFPGCQNLEHIRIGLTRWRPIWDHHLEKIDHLEFKKIGFMKNALEFWHLTNIFLDTDESHNPYGNVKNIDADTMAEVNDLLERFERVAV